MAGRLRRMCRWAAVPALLIVLAPRPAAAITWDTWISPGVSLCWTFGRGLTYGLELSVIWVPSTWDDLKEVPLGTGVVLNLNTDFDDFFLLRVGAEWVGPAIGLEVGPSLVTDENGAHFGLGFTPWVSVYTIPFYTGTLIFDDSPNIHQLGMYLKLHINTDGDFGTHHDWDD
ncbi:MAG: hypothetical protein HY905_21035 [Deltaproteobacteria bacterium]|nr:hypothetical protein [Deltaproteobacteria bacterium]